MNYPSINKNQNVAKMNFLFYTEKLIKVFFENMVIVGIIYDINRTKLLTISTFMVYWKTDVLLLEKTRYLLVCCEFLTDFLTYSETK